MRKWLSFFFFPYFSIEHSYRTTTLMENVWGRKKGSMKSEKNTFISFPSLSLAPFHFQFEKIKRLTKRRRKKVAKLKINIGTHVTAGASRKWRKKFRICTIFLWFWFSFLSCRKKSERWESSAATNSSWRALRVHRVLAINVKSEAPENWTKCSTERNLIAHLILSGFQFAFFARLFYILHFMCEPHRLGFVEVVAILSIDGKAPYNISMNWGRRRVVVT